MMSVRRQHGLGGSRAAGRHGRNAAPRWRHDGSGARWARSDLRLRRILSMTFAPLFTAGGTLFVLLALRAADQGTPSRALCMVLAAVCFLMAGVALLDLDVIKRRRREQRRWHHDT